MSRAEPRRSRGAVAVGVAGEVLVTLGVLVLAFVVWQLWWTDVEADRDQAALVSSLQTQFGDRSPAPSTGPDGRTGGTTALPTPGRTRSPSPAQAPDLTVGVGSAFATIRIPRFGSDYARPVIEGADHEQLDAGIGHVPGSAMPGRIGNFATAGHRVTFGKPYHQIHTLRPGDAVVVETKAGWSVYRFVRHRIVTPDQVEVVAPVPDHPGRAPTQAWMTLIACHPPYSARERYIGYASLERFLPRADGPPTAVLAAPTDEGS